MALVDLFESLKQPNKSEYSVFVVNVRVMKVKSGDITTEFSEPVRACLQPDLSEFKSTMSHCISSIVAASRGFARPEQIIGPSFGGQNSEMIANMLTSSRHKRMNESSVTLTDSIVVDSTNRINTALAEHFQGPALLLEN